jgi:predicted DCC family thiol-disulfide oxidoreductase YuxK
VSSEGVATPARPVLLYDGGCGVCTRLVRLMLRWVRPRVAVEAYQLVDLAAYGLTTAEADAALQLADVGGRTRSAQDAVAHTLLAAGPVWRLAGRALLLPGVHGVAGLVYRWVSRNRHRLPGGTPACSLPAAERPGARGRP